MKKLFLTAVFALIGLSAYCGAAFEMDLVNEQNIALDGIHNISISYNNENVTILKGNTSSLVLKEYMSEDKVDYYADVRSTDGNVRIESGRRPHKIISFGDFRAKAELYVPESYTGSLSVRTSNGRVVIDSVNGDINAETSNAKIEIKNIDGIIDARTINGSIVIDSINGNVGVKASHGSVELKNIDGAADARTDNGSIVIDSVNGNIRAETSNAKITCSTAEVLGDITLITNNGSIDLDIPRDLFFQFSARTINGRVRTSFDNNLSRPVNDDHLYRGIIGPENNPNMKIDLETSNGSISVDWIN